jgi:hypothetical protein
MHVRRAVVAVALAGVFAVATAMPAWAAPTKTFANLNGANEFPGPGDADGVGAGFFDLKVRNGQVCLDVRFANLSARTAMHIHQGAAGVAGPIVVDLTAALTGAKCVPGDSAVLQMIKNNPNGFYCNIHTTDFVAGAIRGQLQLAQ